MQKKHAFFILALVISLALDQGSKMWARASLRPMSPNAQTVIAGYFDMRYSENPGSAFSLFRGVNGARYLLLCIGVGALFVVGYYLKQATPEQKRIGAELGFIAGGALGNMIDRALYGRVTDFIVWKIGTHEWPTFNIADAALVIGVLGLAIDTWPQKNAASEPKRAA
jgi:signal peptidase II